MAQYAFETLRQDYQDLWDRMKVVKVAQANAQAKRIIANKARYKAVEEKTGVKWFVVGCLHMRESNADFGTWLHNGDPMRRNGRPAKTVHVPAGRPPNPDVSWEEGAYDALVVCEQLDKITDWGPERVAYASEKFNGFGYRSPSRNIPSPYLWGGTSVQKPGKFVADGKYDKNVMDPQIGSMAVLRQLMELDQEARFEEIKEATETPKPSAPPPPDLPPPLSPRAEDTTSEVKPIAKSKTIWGGIFGWVMSAGSALFGLFDKLDNPYTLAAFIFIVTVATVAAYLVIKGRIDVNKLVSHLTQDDVVD